MNLLVTAIVRYSKYEEPSGYIYSVDLEHGKITRACPVPEPNFLSFNNNPRGGMRGAKGIAVANDRICIANDCEVRVYDTSWALVNVITHPSCSGIHDILIKDDILWVTSSRNDLVLQFDWSGNIVDYFNYREHEKILRELDFKVPNLLDRQAIFSGKIDFRDPRTHRRGAYDRAHLNSLCSLPDNDVLISLGRLTSKTMSLLLDAKGYLQKVAMWPFIMSANRMFRRTFRLKKHRHTEVIAPELIAGFGGYESAIVRIGETSAVTLIISGTTMPIHSLRTLHDGTVLFTDTNSGQIVRFSPNDGSILDRIPVDDEFLRGMALLSNEHVAVGSQNTLYVVDIVERHLIQKIRLSDDSRVSIFDIERLPAGTEPLPPRLPE